MGNPPTRLATRRLRVSRYSVGGVRICCGGLGRVVVGGDRQFQVSSHHFLSQATRLDPTVDPWTVPVVAARVVRQSLSRGRSVVPGQESGAERGRRGEG